MAVDKSYGSGKSRSAANSRARQRAAAGNFTKGAKPTTRLLKKVAAENPVTGFIGGGVSAIKLGKVASNLFKAGKVQDSMAVGMRAFTKTGGRAIGKGIATGKSPSFKALGKAIPADKNLKLMEEVRGITSRRVFPRGTNLSERALKAQSELRTSIRGSLNYEFPFNRVVNEAERIERKYGLTQRTAEEGLRQAAKRIKPRKSGGR